MSQNSPSSTPDGASTGGAPAEVNPRRDFIREALAVGVGAVAAGIPVLATLPMVLHPLKQGGGAGKSVRVTTLNSLPEDGVPRKFAVISDRTDVWSRSPAVPIGAVYLRRLGERKVQAFNVVCPHAGCFVDYLGDRKAFLCPCHNSTFSVDGRVEDPKSPSPRGLDELSVDIKENGEVWVQFQQFLPGHAERVPQG